MNNIIVSVGSDDAVHTFEAEAKEVYTEVTEGLLDVLDQDDKMIVRFAPGRWTFVTVEHICD